MKTINLLLQQGTQWQSAIAANMLPSNHTVKSERGYDFRLIRIGSLYKDSC